MILFPIQEKKIGEALGTIINVGNTLLWPIKWANERTRIYFENNLKKYEKNLSEIDDQKIVEVPTEIAMPILERFTYVSNEDISNAFINLLTAASSSETIQFAHPSFIQLIDRMSPDEAKIIKHFSTVTAIPHLTICKYSLKPKKAEDLLDDSYKPQIDTSKYFTLCIRKNKITSVLSLDFPQNINIYMDNLISMGLVNNDNDKYYSILSKEIDEIDKDLQTEFEQSFLDIPEDLRKSARKLEKGMYELSEFGRLFIKSCIK